MTSTDITSAEAWRQQLDDLGPLADEGEHSALLAAAPADLPAGDREFLAGYLAGREVAGSSWRKTTPP